MSDPGGGTPRAAGSALTVGAGLVVLGLSASVYLVLAARATGPSAFAGLAVLYTLVYTIGIGLFLPFEQELARAVAHRLATGDGPGPLVRRGVAAATLLLGLLTVLTVATLPWTMTTLFYDSAAAVAGFLLACAGLAVQFVQRGTFSGSGCFRPYAVQIAVEGGVRLVGTAVLVASGVTAAAPYALLLGAAPLVSVLAVAHVFRRLVRGPGQRAAWRELSLNLVWLLTASLAAQGLANLGTVAVRTLGSDLDAVAGHFMSGLTIARLPLFAFGAVQAVLLPHLMRQLVHGQHHTFRRQLLVTVAATGALGLAGVVGTALLGPEIMRLLFGADFSLPRADLVWLAVSTAVYLQALAFQPAVIALGEHRANAVAWTGGLAAFAVSLAAPLEVLHRVELALVVGSTVTAVTLLWRTLRAARETSYDLSLDPATGRLGME